MKKYKKIREILEELAEVNGFVINPICLQDYIYQYLKLKHPKDKNNITKARNASQVFAVLCNEFYLMNINQCTTKEFYMSQERWEKYNIKQRMIETSTQLLKEMNLLSWRYIKADYDAYTHIKLYNINVKTLEEIKDEIIEF